MPPSNVNLFLFYLGIGLSLSGLQLVSLQPRMLPALRRARRMLNEHRGWDT